MALPLTRRVVANIPLLLGVKWRKWVGASKSHVVERIVAHHPHFLWICRGKGLGRNEDGITKHVKVVKREESAGVSAPVLVFTGRPDLSVALAARYRTEGDGICHEPMVA